MEKSWGGLNHDFHTDSSWDQTDHFFKEVFFIHHTSPSIWHIESQPWILSAYQLHFINRPLSAIVGNHRSFKVKAVFAVSKSPVGVFSSRHSCLKSRLHAYLPALFLHSASSSGDVCSLKILLLFEGAVSPSWLQI